MELVYLWVEKYKNIHRQGFNFSPRFKCAYNPDTEELTIDKKDDYIENFFGENINVTAIVGKNGSGKSILLEYLSYKGLGEYEGKQHIYVIREDNTFIIDTTIESEIRIKNKTTLNYIKKTTEENLNIILKNFHQVPRNYITAGKHNVSNISDETMYKKIVENSEYKNKFYDIFSIHESLTLLNFFRVENILLPSDIILPEEIILHIQNPKKIKSDFSFSDNIDKDIQKLLQTAKIDEKTINTFFKALSNLNKKDTLDGYEIKNLNKKDISYFVEILKTLYERNPILTEVLWLHLDKKLSSGTLELLRTYANLFQSLSTIEKNNILICLDEPDSFLHPNWQKQLFNHLINFFQLNYPDRNFHLILTTHSPFLLSDIPKQNIIFLDTDDNGNCKIVDGLNDKKETFGANIHTLLSDSFFMENGLMGEFAKGKIDEAFNLLNKTTITKEEQKYCEEIISIIGEPIIKRQLQKMLDSKRLSKIDKIDELQKQIEVLQQQVEKLQTDA